MIEMLCQTNGYLIFDLFFLLFLFFLELGDSCTSFAKRVK